MNNVKRSWRNYNKSLVERGSITIWIYEDLLKTVYRLTFRSLEGYFNSLFSLVGSEMQSPHYTLFCKRGNEVKDLLPKLEIDAQWK
jgi:hypothetical protein